MKNNIKYLSVFFAFLLQGTFLFGQPLSDCQIEDPLIDYQPEIDLCCGIQYYTVCYKMQAVEDEYGDIDTNGPFRFIGLVHPQGSWSGDSPFASYQDLSSQMDAVCKDSSVFVDFEWDATLKTICTFTTDTSFGNLHIFHQVNPIIKKDSYAENPPIGVIIRPTITAVPCPIIEPDITDILNPSGANVPNETLFSGDVGTVSTHDIMNSMSGDTLGPDANTVGILVNALIESNALKYGTCTDFDCLDIESMGAGLNAGPYADSLNQAFSQSSDPNISSSPPGGGTWSAYLSEQVTIALADIDLVELLNTSLGLQIPPSDSICSDTILTTPMDSLENYSWFPFDRNNNDAEFNPPNPTAKTGADQDYFSQEIAGLGSTGPSMASPSPSALEMIKGVNGGVDLYNGSQSTSIPLYNLQANDISIPISISSSNNGLKVNDLGTLVGQNWNLDVGGMISRVVQGLPDEFNGVTRGVGVGRRYVLTPRLEIPSNMGLKVTFPGDDKFEALCDDLRRQIKQGKNLNEEPIAIGAAEMDISWTPLQPTLVNFSVRIPVFTIFSVTVLLEIGFNVGFTPNEEMGNIFYEEAGKGFFHLGSNNTQINYQSDLSKLEVLKDVHPAKKVEDITFLVDQAHEWETWIKALTFDYKYKTERQDTKPDEFYFSAGGYSGKFYFDVDKNPILFPDIDGLVVIPLFENDDNIIGFTIQTPDGMKYTYGKADVTENTNYALPNFYTYPEIGNNKDKFGKAVIEKGRIVSYPFIGPKRVHTYGNTYDRNYKIMDAPKYTSAWHLIKVESLLTLEEVYFDYDSTDLRYYADKSYSHTFPNFDTDGTDFTTTKNGELNLLHLKSTKWENGRADFTYSATETRLKRYHLTKISTTAQRGESVRFSYTTPRAEIVGDYVCDSIKVYRGAGGNQQLYKGWKLDYHSEQVPPEIAGCDPDGLPDNNVIVGIKGETKFDLGEDYKIKWFDYHRHFFINFSISCFRIPLRLDIPIPPIKFLDQDFGYKSHLTEYGSLMEVKALGYNAFFGVGYNPDEEAAIFNAEKNRTFLRAIQEIDIHNVCHPFIDTIAYKGILADFPKRFDLNQDLFGYYNPNRTGSPFPAINYTAIGVGNPISGLTMPETINHFGFFNVAGDGNMHLGQSHPESVNYTHTGALSRIGFASGGSIGYQYELNVLPNNNFGAGIRVAELIESPLDMPSKSTKYSYQNPTEVIAPIRIDQNPFNYYYKDLEEKVVATSASQNHLFPNKNNHVGYEYVTEFWGDSLSNLKYGRIVHKFTIPGTNPTPLRVPYDANPICLGLNEHVSGIACSSCTQLTNIPLGQPNLPASQVFPSDFKYQNWTLGLEVETSVYNRVGDLRQKTENTYESYPQVPHKKVQYFNSEMYQYNYPGSFWDNYQYRTIREYLPYTALIDPLITRIFNLITLGQGIFQPHPYRYISRNYLACDHALYTGFVRVTNSKTTNYYLGGGSKEVNTDYAYYFGQTFQPLPSQSPTIPKTITTQYGDSGLTSVTENFFVDENSVELQKFDGNTLIHLQDSINFRPPLASRTELTTPLEGTQIIGDGFTALTMDGGRVVPLSNWTRRQGNLQLLGKFESYDSNGKPQTYRLAHHNADINSGPFFPPISMIWNDQLQLKNRTYIDFTTQNKYNEYFEIDSLINPDGILTRYQYDSRWRIGSVISQNGRQTTNYTYNIAPNDNYVQTEIVFSDGNYPSQINTQTLDGFGRALILTRDNDGAILSGVTYDDFFRTESQYNITSGLTQIRYEDSPIPRWTEQEDAVKNITTTSSYKSDNYFERTETKDPNGHITKVHTDGLGRTRKQISGAGGITTYNFDAYGRLYNIVNPESNTYHYIYNDMDKVVSTQFPGAEPKTYVWDNAFRPINTVDGENNDLSFIYDNYNRLLQVSSVNEGALLTNQYENGHTWLEKTTQTILTDGGTAGQKITENLNIDDIGRPTSIRQQYPDGTIISTPTYTDAGIVPMQITQISGTNIPAVDMTYRFEFDDVLRPQQTTLNINGQERILSRLQYNAKDLVQVKLLGESLVGGFLQKVDYDYDLAGKLLNINTPGEMECFADELICTLTGSFCYESGHNLNTEQAEGCDLTLTDIEIEGQSYSVNLNLQANGIAPLLEGHIEEALDYFGYFGEVSVNGYYAGTQYCYDIIITETNVQNVALLNEQCVITQFVVGECCDKNVTPPSGPSGGSFTQNDDLFYERIIYDHLDIARIDMASNCLDGKIRNEYSYDADHRITKDFNIFFIPQRTPDRYSTAYSYLPAGSIDSLTRYGYVEGLPNNPVYGIIDQLKYDYNQTNGQLSSIADNPSSTPNAQPKGFSPLSTTYTYDDNGNIITGGGNSATYNLLNLPKTLTGTNGTITIDYTYGGEKTKIAGVKNKLYLGGVEYVDTGNGYQPEAYYHGEGRVLFAEDSLRFQYKLDDHLGDLMVFFEDRDSDGDLLTESETSNMDSLEVFQRHLYYPFGLNYEGIWSFDFEQNNPAIPHNDYQYNGKELDKETGSNWSFYGFRMYDATIGRFTGVDPISDQFAFVSTYNYAENSPIRNIDLHGLQRLDMVQRQYQEGSVGGGVLADQVGKEDLKPLYEAQVAGGAAGAAVSSAGMLLVEMGVVGVANEIKDEALSQLTNGWSDFLDVSKQLAKLAKNGVKKLFKKSDDVIESLCFVSGTEVLINDGDKKIEDIFESNIVWGYNQLNDSLTTRALYSTFCSQKENIEFFSNPNTLMNFWSNEFIPLDSYNEREIEIQKRINEKEIGIITYSPVDKEKEWLEIDEEEITPYTWKWVHLELKKEDGTLSNISLRRPNWWIKENDVDKVGNRVNLSLPEMRISGTAIVKQIAPNQLDTRLWDKKRKGNYVSRPITGKFEHESADVWNYYFEGLGIPIGATSTHPFWSEDRRAWVAVGDLKIGEKVKTKDGSVKLKSKIKLEGKQKVYNLEVYRDHNFFVTGKKLLVHNTCWKERLEKFMGYAEEIDPKSLRSQDETIDQLENVFTMLDKTRTDDKVLKLVGKNNVRVLDDGTKEIMQAGAGNATYVYPNGGFQIYRNGRVEINKIKD